MVLKESVDIASLTSANAYDTTLYDTVSIPFTLDDTAVSVGGSTRFGNDGFWRYQKNEVSPIVFGYWVYASFLGSSCSLFALCPWEFGQQCGRLCLLGSSSCRVITLHLKIFLELKNG